MDVYVYYHVADELVARAETQIDALLASLTPHCTGARRARRCDDATTWMEVYEGIDTLAPFMAVLDAAVESFDCAEFTRGERHVECFVRAVKTD